MPTEVLHGLYDGGHGAGLDDLWSRMMEDPLAVGAIPLGPRRRGDRAHRQGTALSTPTGNHAPDGIVGPYREKEASFFTIKEIWSPVFVELGRSTDCRRRSTDGSASRTATTSRTSRGAHFEWRLVRFPGPTTAPAGHRGAGVAASPPGYRATRAAAALSTSPFRRLARPPTRST